MLSFIDTYNAQIRSLRSWSNLHNITEPSVSLALWLLPISLSYHIFLLLCGSVALMIASTIYAAKCPERVKEFSLERWTKELGQGTNSYIPLTWSSPVWRQLCGVLFVSGSLVTASVLFLRLTKGFIQAWNNL